MTPLEKALEVGRSRGLDGFGGTYPELIADDARAIIRAFLEAAAEDEADLRRISKRVWHAEDWPHDIKAAILALKETING